MATNKYSSFQEFLQAQYRNLAEVIAQTTVREAAIITAGEMKRRVENEGKGTNGLLKTKSKKKFGAYSYAYGKRRQNKGRQTAKIDLNFTGLMWRNWRPVPTDNGFGVTFVSMEALNRAMWNEQRFGPIFTMTEKELKIGQAAIIKRVRTILKRR